MYIPKTYEVINKNKPKEEELDEEFNDYNIALNG